MGELLGLILILTSSNSALGPLQGRDVFDLHVTQHLSGQGERAGTRVRGAKRERERESERERQSLLWLS